MFSQITQEIKAYPFGAISEVWYTVRVPIENGVRYDVHRLILWRDLSFTDSIQEFDTSACPYRWVPTQQVTVGIGHPAYLFAHKLMKAVESHKQGEVVGESNLGTIAVYTGVDWPPPIPIRLEWPAGWAEENAAHERVRDLLEAVCIKKWNPVISEVIDAWVQKYALYPLPF